MKVLLVEDDVKIADRRPARAAGRGLHGRGGIRRGGRPLAGHRGLLRPDRARHHAAGRNGFQVCADLRDAGDWTPILMLTAKDGDLDEAEALDTGADDYLTKPFSFPVLVARVRALLRRSGGGAPPPVAVGDLRIDPGGHRVWRGDTEIQLTAREFDVLEFLCAGAARCCPRTRSSPACGTTTSTATEHRRGVHRPAAAQGRRAFGCDSIETVRGAGYRLDGS